MVNELKVKVFVNKLLKVYVKEILSNKAIRFEFLEVLKDIKLKKVNLTHLFLYEFFFCNFIFKLKIYYLFLFNLYLYYRSLHLNQKNILKFWGKLKSFLRFYVQKLFFSKNSKLLKDSLLILKEKDHCLYLYLVMKYKRILFFFKLFFELNNDLFSEFFSYGFLKGRYELTKYFYNYKSLIKPLIGSKSIKKRLFKINKIKRLSEYEKRMRLFIYIILRIDLNNMHITVVDSVGKVLLKSSAGMYGVRKTKTKRLNTFSFGLIGQRVGSILLEKGFNQVEILLKSTYLNKYFKAMLRGFYLSGLKVNSMRLSYNRPYSIVRKRKQPRL